MATTVGGLAEQVTEGATGTTAQPADPRSRPDEGRLADVCPGGQRRVNTTLPAVPTAWGRSNTRCNVATWSAGGGHPKSEIATALDAASKARLAVEIDKKGTSVGPGSLR
jgi:hypothetical protein